MDSNHLSACRIFFSLPRSDTLALRGALWFWFTGLDVLDWVARSAGGGREVVFLWASLVLEYKDLASMLTHCAIIHPSSTKCEVKLGEMVVTSVLPS